MADTTCPARSVVQIPGTKIGLQRPFLDALELRSVKINGSLHVELESLEHFMYSGKMV